jgi:hypothetical protein
VQHPAPIPPVQPLKDDKKDAFDKAGEDGEGDRKREQACELNRFRDRRILFASRSRFAFSGFDGPYCTVTLAEPVAQVLPDDVDAVTVVVPAFESVARPPVLDAKLRIEVLLEVQVAFAA